MCRVWLWLVFHLEFYVISESLHGGYDVPLTLLRDTVHGTPEEDLEIVHLSNNEHPKYSFEVFGNKVKLDLKRNEKLVSDSFKSYLHDGGYKHKISGDHKDCLYIHRDNLSSAAVNLCHNNSMHGLVFFENYVLEIAPATLEEGLSRQSSPHLVKRSYVPDNPWDIEIGMQEFRRDRSPPLGFSADTLQVASNRSELRNQDPVLEAALFFDEAAYKIFAPFFKYQPEQIRDMLLAYMNGVQALYHHPSSGKRLDITLTRLEMFRSQPSDLPTYNGDREPLLDSFCGYNFRQNPPDDNDPDHWDIGLYVSGLDFYAFEKGKKSGVTMGLAVVGGVCQGKYACVIAEFGVTNIFGKPYPSAGFTSVFVLAHEIGHSLGMHHDGYTNDCPKDGFIMSPSRGVYGETIWSKCSAEVLAGLADWASCLYDKPKILDELDHSKFEDTPGVIWNLKRQCELLLKDQDAEPFHNQQEEEVCKNLQCRSPHRAGFYFAGPAMEGTICAAGKWCQGGECLEKPSNILNEITEGGWSEWKEEPCDSGCLFNAKGYRRRQRSCSNPPPKNTNKGCDGLSHEVYTCNDSKICRARRKSVEEYASEKCKEFSLYIKDIDTFGAGLQAPHEQDRLWMGCTIFCRRSDGSSYYTPRVELNDAGINPYFPDGTWCHYDRKNNYYCLQHHCLPENFLFNKNFVWLEDMLISQNAPPNLSPLPDNLKRYLSLDSKGNPVLKKFTPDSSLQIPEDAWSTKDYIEID